MVRHKNDAKPTDRDLRDMTDNGERVASEPSRPEQATPGQAADPVTDDEVRVRAYHLWEAAGWPASNGVEFWLKAERELRFR